MSAKVLSKKQALIIEAIKLEDMIRNTTDPKALVALRSDYRNVLEKLETYYDDEREGLNNE